MRIYMYSLKDRRNGKPQWRQQVCVYDNNVARDNIRSAYKAMRKGGTDTTGARILIWALVNNGIDIHRKLTRRG